MERPMKWHKFLIYFLLWLSGVGNIITGFRSITGSQYGAQAQRVYSYFTGLKTIDVIFGLFAICLGIFIIVTRFKLAGFKAAGPKYLTLMYVLGASVSIFYIIAVISTTSLTLSDIGGLQIIIQIVMPIIIITINKSYYDKRADLFVN